MKMADLRDPAALVAAIPVSIVVILGTLASVRSHQVASLHRELVTHSYQVINLTNELVLSAADSETGQRGFIITGDDEFLQPFAAASENRISDLLLQLQTSVHDNAAQSAKVKALQKLVADKLSELTQTVEIRRTQGFEAAKAGIERRRGKILMDDIRREAHLLEAAETTLLTQRINLLNSDDQRYIRIAILTVILSTIVRLAVAYYRSRSAR